VPVADRADRADRTDSADREGEPAVTRLADDPQILEVLAARNQTLARFWLQEQPERPAAASLAVPPGLPVSSSLPVSASLPVSSGPAVSSDRAGRAGSLGRIVVINAEDDFTGMLAHLLNTLGFDVEVHPWQALNGTGGPALAAAELVLLGPGPGDPNDLSDQRILALHLVAKTRLASAAPVLGICLGHQILSVALGLRVERLPSPDQGRQTGIDLFGTAHRVGFYNSYVVAAPDHPVPGLTFSLDQDRVQAVRGDQVTGLQFHPESVLTTAGLEILETELARLRPHG
jgi:phenazine biosynthesis protein phzE